MDPVHFTGREILEVALRIEENGVKFYTDASKAFKNANIVKIFQDLAKEEAVHIKVFRELIKLVPESGPFGEYTPYMEEASDYLNALANSEVFTRPEEGAKLPLTVRSEKDAVEYAIQMEKESLLFYLEMKNMIREKDKAVIDNLIEQEKNHLSQLTAIKNEFFR
ncbi:MAG: ferritin family protein [Deltaproteobacteria bacterium]|nr:ferritin family protein [Deltaproteobacteria bacterium]